MSALQRQIDLPGVLLHAQRGRLSHELDALTGENLQQQVDALRDALGKAWVLVLIHSKFDWRLANEK